VPAHVQKRLRDEANARLESLKTKTLTISNLTKTIHDCMPHTPHTPTYVCCSVLQSITVCCSEMQCVVIASRTHTAYICICVLQRASYVALSHTHVQTQMLSLPSTCARAQYLLLSDALPCPPSASKRHGHDDNGSTRGTQGGRCAAG